MAGEFRRIENIFNAKLERSVLLVLLLLLLLLGLIQVMFSPHCLRHRFLLNASHWWRHFTHTGHVRSAVTSFHNCFHLLIQLLMNPNLIKRRLDVRSESSQIHRKSSVHPQKPTEIENQLTSKWFRHSESQHTALLLLLQSIRNSIDYMQTERGSTATFLLNESLFFLKSDETSCLTEIEQLNEPIVDD